MTSRENDEAGSMPLLGHREMEIPSNLKELGLVRAFVRSACRDVAGSPLDDSRIDQLELAVTEACSNIVRHAYHGRDDQVIHLEIDVFSDRVSVRLYHFGDPFDPSRVPPPALDGSRDSGYGVYLIARCVDEVRYFSDDQGRNFITLLKTGKS